MTQQRTMPRLSRRWRARRGSMVITAFIFVVAMTLVAAGIHTMLKQQLDQGVVVKGVSLGKLQSLYLAEMGVNYWMYTANQGLSNPFPAAAAIGTVDFKTRVAMVRNLPSGVATCTASNTPAAKLAAGYPRYQVAAHLVTSDGTFDRTVYFDAAKLATAPGQYVLSSYRTK